MITLFYEVSVLNSEAKAFFDTLPLWLRENILQSGVRFNTRNELEDIARNFSSECREKPDNK